MSLAETQQIMADLKEIMHMLQTAKNKAAALNEETKANEKAYRQFVMAERISLRYLALARQMGLPDEVEQATQIVTSLVVMLRMLQMSATMISGGGLGALIGIAGVVSVTLMANDMLGYDAMRGY